MAVFFVITYPVTVAFYYMGRALNYLMWGRKVCVCVCVCVFDNCAFLNFSFLHLQISSGAVANGDAIDMTVSK